MKDIHLSFVTYNVRGIQKDVITLQNILANHDLHVMCLQEINLKHEVEDLAIPGFKLFLLPSFHLNGITRHGLATYVRSNLSCSPLHSFDLLDIHFKPFESP